RATAEGDVQVVLMNGGGADVLLGSCETVDAECPVITEAVLAAEELLAQMAEDGVARLLYVFYPDPGDPELQAKLDVLRPALQSLCEAGPTVCDWLDLRPRFSGMEDDYLQAAGLTLTSEGARVAAEEMWGAMQGWCTEAMYKACRRRRCPTPTTPLHRESPLAPELLLQWRHRVLHTSR